MKSCGLVIRDENRAAAILSTYSYYEIINGYKEIGIEQEEKFKNGTRFEKLVDFFLMDKSIPTNINLALQEIEAHLRTILSYVVAEYYTADQDKYLQRRIRKEGLKNSKNLNTPNFYVNTIRLPKTKHNLINIIEKYTGIYLHPTCSIQLLRKDFLFCKKMS